MSVVFLSESNFSNEVERSELPVLVDLYADWCAPCKAMEPVLEAVEREFTGRLKVCRADVAQAPRLATRFKIFSIPTLLLFNEGAVMDKLVGNVSKERLIDRINNILLKKEAK
ncbi:MAG: thioredoxin [candidate division Zixibacteria bacterium 4484_93]|mgnify:CR=1 FL=1|nr:MAG: thioredoxin [candidate division Zixibacteria bacterium 4484_93]